MNPLYNIGIILFGGVLRVAATHSPKVREMLRGQRDTLAQIAETRRRVAPDGFDVWFHAASLGEFEQGRPLIERLRREKPDIKILLTFFSPSGYRVRHNYPAVDAVHYLPLDSPRSVRRFLDAAAPRRVFFIKYEFWGNYLSELSRRGIPTYIISAIFRPGQRFFRRGGGMFRHMLRCFTRLYVQDERSRRLLASVGVDNVTVAGDTRFDRVTDIMRDAAPLPAPIASLAAGAPFTFVAGSSWPSDEDLIIPWFHANPSARLIIAPHEFDDRRLHALLDRLGPGAVLLSSLLPDAALPDGCRAIVVDSFGLLSSIYRIASAACVGGGFGAGIHNINEAAVYGIPVLFGPNNHKFREAAGLVDCGGGFEISSSVDFNSVMDRLASDESFRRAAGQAAGDYIAANIGASDIIYNDNFK